MKVQARPQPLSPLGLMRLYDGELDSARFDVGEGLVADELAAVSFAVGAADAEQLAGLAQLSEGFEAYQAELLDAASFESFADGLMERLGEEPAYEEPAHEEPAHEGPAPLEGAAPLRPGLQVLEGGVSKPALERRFEAMELPGPPSQLATMRERRWVFGVGALLAAAASVGLWLQLKPVAELPDTAQGTPSAQSTGPEAGEVAPGSLSAIADAVISPGLEDPVAIVTVDFGGSDGTIFVVGDDSTPVVWLDDAPPVGGHRIGPL